VDTRSGPECTGCPGHGDGQDDNDGQHDNDGQITAPGREPGPALETSPSDEVTAITAEADAHEDLPEGYEAL
jgi:hypothetical protein